MDRARKATGHRVVKWTVITILAVLIPVTLHYGRILMLLAPPIGGPTYTRSDCLSVVVVDGDSHQEKERLARSFMHQFMTETTSRTHEVIQPWIRMVRGDGYALLSYGGHLVPDGSEAGQYRLHIVYWSGCDRKDAMTRRAIGRFTADHPAVPPPRIVPMDPLLDQGLGCVNGPAWIEGDERCP